MDKRVNFPITADIIAEGMRRNSIYCPIATAIRRVLPGATGIRVDLQTVRWTDPEQGLRYAYLTPIAAQQLIVDFDQGYGTDRLKPFTMRLRDGRIFKTRTEEERRARRERDAPRAAPTAKTITVKRGGVMEVYGGDPPVVGNPASPANHRRYGARQLRP